MTDTAAPAYTATDEDGLVPWIEGVAARAAEIGLPLTRLPPQPDPSKGGKMPESPEPAATQRQIIMSFFPLVRTGQTDMVTLYVRHGLVSPDVLEWAPEWGMDETREQVDPGSSTTPLLAAVEVGDAAMVRTLAALGADVDLLARPRLDLRKPHKSADEMKCRRRCRRTPLMLAAATGRLVLVRLLWSELHANDALLAPDGQLALRLAADAGHHDIVALLPARRGGSWRRFRTRHDRAMRRAAAAARGIASFVSIAVRLVGWHLPRFVLWTLPKGIAVELGRTARLVWAKRRELLAAMRHLPTKLAQFVRGLGEAAVETAHAAVRVLRRMPAALRIAAGWVAESAARVGHAVAHAVSRLVAALHTAAAAVAAALARMATVTPKDVWAALVVAARAVCIELPGALAGAVRALGERAADMLETLFGLVGMLIKWIGIGLLYVAAYVPKRLWRIVCAMGSSVGGGYHEVRVWMNPKYGG